MDALRTLVRIGLHVLEQQWSQARRRALRPGGGAGPAPDRWGRRAGPVFLYVFYLYLLAAFPVGLLAVFAPEAAGLLAAGAGAWLAAIPRELWAAFVAGYLGYAGLRSLEKIRRLDL